MSTATRALVLLAVAALGFGAVYFIGLQISFPDRSDATPLAPNGSSPPPSFSDSVKIVPAGSVPVSVLSAEAIKKCLRQSGESGSCLDGLFRAYLSKYSTTDALALMRQYEASDSLIRLSCHPVLHALGRETFRKQKTIHDSFAVCDQTCHSGCYHGAMERFLRGDAASDDAAGHISTEELRQKAASACDPNLSSRFRFQCLHGLGHALVFFSDYDLLASLQACDATGDGWSRSSCYGGAFMENVHSATPEKRDLSATDYHYPCSKLDAKYKSDCYMMQTSRMVEMGLGTPQLFDECRTTDEYRYICMQSIGRDLSNDVRIGKTEDVARKCELGVNPEERQACVRGVAYALVDNTWDGRYAFPFCTKFAGADDTAYCFRIAAGYLRGTFEQTPDELRQQCSQYVPGDQTCLNSVEL